MKPASELTAEEAAVWVAEKVMGWTLREPWGGFSAAWTDSDDKPMRAVMGWSSKLLPWSPLTDAADALAMLEAWCTAAPAGRKRNWRAWGDGKMVAVTVDDAPEDPSFYAGGGTSDRRDGCVFMTAAFAAVYAALENGPT